MKQNRPLSGIRVLDFGQYLAGPLVGMMLADLGAEVLRVDPPEGPRFKSPALAMLSRGKQLIKINLKSNSGRETVLQLAQRVDVVIDNFRPGVMDRLGVGSAALRAENNQLIYLSLPGFASTDPELAGLAAWEAVIAARTGQFTDMGLNRRLMGIKASYTPLGLASAYASTFGAMSVLFALNARETSGGDFIEVPLASSLFEGLAYNHAQIEAYPDRYKSPRELELDRRSASGEPCNLSFDQLSEFLDPFYRTYMCQDGRGFYVVSGSVATHPARVLTILGLKQLLDELPLFDPYLDTTEWPYEWTLNNYPVGAKDRARIASAMKAAFLTKPSQEWEALFGAGKAPATAQRTTQEWLHDPHALASGLVLNVNDAEHGSMQQMGNVAWLASDSKATEKVSATSYAQGQNRLEQILNEPPRAEGQNHKQAGWLDGFRVVDLTNVIAGPTIASTLARFGAHVTHVQPVNPSVDPWNTVVFGLQANRGKESVLLDLDSEQGRNVLKQLIENADAVTLNATNEQRDKLGLSPKALAKINPRAILVQLDAFGGPDIGPKSNHLGYDDLAQAATGIMLRFGGGMETPEEHAHAGTIDVLAGLTACVALGAALIQQKATGKADIARSSLAAAGNMIQAQFMYDFNGRAPFNEPSGRSTLGWDPFYHCYEASDGWFFFAAPKERHWILSDVLELPDPSSCPEADLYSLISKAFKTKPIAFWAARLNKGSAAVVPLASMLKTRDDSLQLESSGAIDIRKSTYRSVRHDFHPMGRWCDLAAPNAIRPSNATIKVPGPAPKFGHQTHTVLEGLGYKKDEIEAMLDAGVVGSSWSKHYLPD